MPADSLIGRERMLAELVELVGSHRLVTLTGVGGVGKTRMSIEVGAALAGEQPDGVWMVELAPLTDPTAVLDTIATTLGVTPQPGAPVLHALVEALSGWRAVIVLDNCEHVVGAVAAAVTALISGTPTLRVLATSREALEVPGEQRRLVLPLALDGGVSSPAVTLFVERARDLRIPHRLRGGGDRGGRRRDLSEPRRATARHRAGSGADDLDEPDRHPGPAR